MALKLLTAIGQTDGVDVTVANSDDFGDNALTAVTLGTGSTIKYSTEQATPAANLVSLKVTGPSGQQAVVQQGGGLAQLYLTGSYFFYFTDRPPVGGRTKIIQPRSSTTTGGVTIDSDGFLRCENTAGTTIFTGATQVPLNQWIRIDYAEVADTTTTGTTHFAWFNVPTSNTVVESFDATNVNHLTANLTITNIGKVTASTWATPFYIATLRTQDALGLLGPFGAEKTSSSTDSIGITGSVSTQAPRVVVVTDTIGITDTGGQQTLDVGMSVTDTIGIVDGSETLDTAGLLARWVADDLVQGGAADGSLVTAWSEWSDQVPDALAQPTTASQPTLRSSVAGLNGHAAVEFDGVGNFLSVNGSALALAQNVPSFVVFAVYQLFPTDVVAGPCVPFALSSGTSAAQHRAALYSHSPSLLPQVAGRRLDINSLQSINGQAIPTGHAGILYGRWQYATAYAELYQDGALTASVTPFQTAGNTSNTASLAGAIGSRASGVDQFFPGQIADVLIYSDVSTAQRQRIQAYLATTYGIALNDVVAYSGDVGGLFWDTPIVTDGNVMIDPGSAARTITATVTAAGTAKVTGAATASAAFAVTTTGVVSRGNGVVFVATATVAAAGTNAVTGDAARPVTATVSAAGNMAANSGTGISLAATVTAAGVIAGTSSAVLQLATFAATSTGAVNGLSGAAVVAAATVSSTGRANLAGTGAVTAAATITAAGALSLSSGAAVAATFGVAAGPGAAFRTGDAALGFGAAITAGGGSSIPSAVSATFAVTAAGSVAGSLAAAQVSAAAAIAAAGAVSAANTAAVTALVTVTTSGTTAASGATTPVAISAAIMAVGSMGLRSPAAVSVAFGTVAVAGPGVRSTDAALIFGTQVSAAGATATPAALAVAFSITAAGSITGAHSAAQVTAVTAVLSAGAVITTEVAAVAASVTVTTSGVVTLAPASAAVSAVATVLASGVVAAVAAGSAVAVTTTIVATGLLTRSSGASMPAVVTVVATGAIVGSGTAVVLVGATVGSAGTTGSVAPTAVTASAQITATGSITAYASASTVVVTMAVAAAGQRGAVQGRVLAIAAVVTAVGRVGRYSPHPIVVGPPRDTFAGYLRSP